MIRVNDWQISRLTREISRLFLKRGDISRFPHVTLYGTFRLKTGMGPGILRDLIEQAADHAHHLPFAIAGWTRMQGRKGEAIGYHVDPSPFLDMFYRHLTASLLPATESRIWIDRAPEKRRMHITFAFNLAEADAERIWEFLHQVTPPAGGDTGRQYRHSGQAGKQGRGECTDLEGYRVAVFRNGALKAEYDLPTRQWLDRAGCFSPAAWRNTFTHFRRLQGYERDLPRYARDPETYLISDLHLDHENIIRYCRRPFSDAHEMSRILIRNWNCTVRPDETIYHLGDLRYISGKGMPGISGPAPDLRGRVCQVRGNHDDDHSNTIPALEISCGGEQFLLIHNPDNAPAGFPGWVIHGHMHNHDLCRYPFFNRKCRRINVSAEVVGYIPVGMMQVLALIHSGVDTLRTLPREKEPEP
jgi:calcineurin-like phosphoesterase family protein